jgi:hypothetical protein
MSRINDFENLPDVRGSHFSAFDELQFTKPHTIEVDDETYDKLLAFINSEPKDSPALRRLFERYRKKDQSNP